MSLLTRWKPNSITHFDPLRQLADFERSMERRLERLFGRTSEGLGDGGAEPITERFWEPATDITEDEKEYVIKAEIPEMKKEDVKVTVEGGALRISGERKAEKEEKTKKYHRIERSYGSFLRTFTLPDGADATKVNADYKDGVLTVHLPKSAESKAKAIEVAVS